MTPTLGTLRDLDIMQLEGEAYATEIYNDFMGELYGKRERPDKKNQDSISSASGMFGISAGPMGGGDESSGFQSNPPY